MATLTKLKTRFARRGFDYLPDEVQVEFINDSYQEICDLEDWSFLEASTSGTAPLTITDLRTVESVRNSTVGTLLSPLSKHNILMDVNQDLTTTGTPSYYYVTGSNVVNVYPTNTTNTIAVTYWKVADALEDDSDEPLSPERFDDVILYGARAAAYWDSDNADMAQIMTQRQEKRLEIMREVLLYPQHDSPDEFVQVTNALDG